MKKNLKISMLCVVLVVFTVCVFLKESGSHQILETPNKVAHLEKAIFNFDGIDSGTFQVNYVPEEHEKSKTYVLIAKVDITGRMIKKTVFPLHENLSLSYPLMYGKGKYKVSLCKLEDTENENYRIFEEQYIEKQNKNTVEDYLSENVLMPFNQHEFSKIKKLAIKLTKDCKTDRQKQIAIAKYIVDNFEYDYVLYESMNKTGKRKPFDVINTFNTKKGVCADFSLLYASMLRSIDIPCMYVDGFAYDYGEEKPHAWNSLYDEATNSWFVIDITRCLDFVATPENLIHPTEKYHAKTNY